MTNAKFLEGSGADCWEWTGRIDKFGYGRQHYALAHRHVYEKRVGPIPTGLELDHLCMNTRCVNPAHLEPVTRRENMRRRTALVTHCKNGHPFDEENTRVTARRRFCRACDRVKAARYLAKKAVLNA